MDSELIHAQQAKDRATSLYIIRAIVEKHGGSVEVDLFTNTLNIDVPGEVEAQVAMEIEEAIGDMCC